MKLLFLALVLISSAINCYSSIVEPNIKSNQSSSSKDNLHNDNFYKLLSKISAAAKKVNVTADTPPFQVWTRVGHFMTTTLQAITNAVLGPMAEITLEADVSGDCSEALFALSSAAKQQKKWVGRSK